MLAAPNAVAAFGFDQADVSFDDMDGSLFVQAGAHPFAMTTTLRPKTSEDAGQESPDGDLRHLRVDFPPGLIAMPTAMPHCSNVDFLDVEGDENACSDVTALGLAQVTASSAGPIAAGSGDFLDPAPVYNLAPVDGSVARIGLVAAGQPVAIELGLSDIPPYNAFARVGDLTQAALFYSLRLTLWGNPAHSAHDADRGQCAFSAATCPANAPPRPFLTMPRSCDGPLETGFDAVSWDVSPQFFSTTALSNGLSGCKNLSFLPQLRAQPSTNLADTPSGLDLTFDVADEGLSDPSGFAHSEIKDLVLEFPEGLIVNDWPLAMCSPAQLAQETLDSGPGDGCPLGSRVGSIEVETPLMPSTVLAGGVFAASTGDIYVVLRSSQLGILVKQVGIVAFDPWAEVLVVALEDLPQLPVSHVAVHLDDDRLLTPLECDEYTTVAAAYPWARPSTGYLIHSRFEIVAGRAGGPCSSGAPPMINPPAVGSPTLPPPTATRKARRCPKGKRRVVAGGARKRARCVRKRCRRPRLRASTVRRCARSHGRRRR